MVTFTNTAFNGITPGQPFTITWSDANGPVTISLNAKSLPGVTSGDTIAQNQIGTTYTSYLGAGVYNFELLDPSGAPSNTSPFEIDSQVVTQTGQTVTRTSQVTSETPTVITISHSSSNKRPDTTIFSTVTGTPRESPSLTQTDIPTPTSTPQSSFSSGAKAGIGAGITLGVILVFGIAAFFFWFGKRAARRSPNKAEEASENENQGPSEMEGHGVNARAELAGNSEIQRELIQERRGHKSIYGDVGAAEVDNR